MERIEQKTGNGLADLIMKRAGTYYVYEIKPNSIYGRATGREQLAGYVAAIRNIIENGGLIGKYGGTTAGERVQSGNLYFTGITESPLMPRAQIIYYTYGDGVIYYDIVWRPDPEPVEEPAVESDPDSFIEKIENLDWEQLTIEMIEAILSYLVVVYGIKSIAALAAMINPATLTAIIAALGIIALYTLIKDAIDNPGSTTSQPPCLT